METKEIRVGEPTPDPVFVQRALATEFIEFSPDGSMLASGHGDGTVRPWNVTISGSEMIASEAFSENDAGRWTSSGKRSGTRDGWASSAMVWHTTPFRGHRGRHDVAANDLGGETHSLTIDEAWDISGYTGRGLQLAAVAAPDAFEPGDFLRLLADTDGDGEFETKVAEFLPDSDGDLARGGPIRSQTEQRVP